MINQQNKDINQSLIDALIESFEGTPWHGRSLISIINRSEVALSPRALALINHIIAWRQYVAKALTGQEEKIELNTEKDWPPVTETQEKIIDRLYGSQEKLLTAIHAFDQDLWDSKPAYAKCTFRDLCKGVRDHDIYHSAQIATEIANN